MGRATVALPQVTARPQVAAPPQVAASPQVKGALYRATLAVPTPSTEATTGPASTGGAPGNPVRAGGTASTGQADPPFYTGEDSGSLTGHVLAGGIARAEPHSRSRTTFMVLLIGGVVLILVAFGVTFATAADEAVGNLLSQIFGTA